MNINKLTIVDGIIQDKYIAGIPVYVDIIKPFGKNNVRTLIPLRKPIGTTNHNTANDHPTASDTAHANYFNSVEIADKDYVGAMLFVDHDSITQILPLNEVSYNAGDGKGDGNYATISIEICENMEYERAEYNAKVLNTALILTYPHFQVFKHQDWSNKNCPRRLLELPEDWGNFVTDIEKMVIANTQKDEVPDMYAEGWHKAVMLGIEDGLHPNEPVTAAKLMTYFDKIGILDHMLLDQQKCKGCGNKEV